MTTVERIQEYGMAVPIEEQVGFRLRLAKGFEYPYAPQHDPGPRRAGRSGEVMVKTPDGREWTTL